MNGLSYNVSVYGLVLFISVSGFFQPHDPSPRRLLVSLPNQNSGSVPALIQPCYVSDQLGVSDALRTPMYKLRWSSCFRLGFDFVVEYISMK